MNITTDPETIERAGRVRELMNDYLRNMTPQERDRRIQIHLAEARRPEHYMVTAEDIILMKLVWRRDTRSAKQWENALSVARVQGARMDWKYLFEQARSLDVEDDLVKLRDEAGI